MNDRPTSENIMARLKAETRDLHNYAETRPLQKALIQGTLPRDAYAAYLGQMLLVHAALEEEIRARQSTHPAFAKVFREHQQREPNLRTDLEFHGLDPVTVEPLPATRAAIQTIASVGAQNPLALLGMLYVLEGSTNGSKFIARSLGRAYDLQSGPGLSYLDPYGEKQTEIWQMFKADMDAVGFRQDEMNQLVEAAKQMFQMVADISDELYEPVVA